MKLMIKKTLLAAVAVAMLGTGCGDKSGKPQSTQPRKAMAAADPLAVVLAYDGGTNRTDLEIQRRQEQIRSGPQAGIALERLGWLFVTKARETFDAGFYKLAEQCALALDARESNITEALLLRGHVLQNLHRFSESEAVARELVSKRGLAFDYAVLGDALMEQGKLDEAVEVYQTMADLKPDSQAATRAAHIRWLKGDVTGAIEAMELAAGAVSPRDSENAAWVFARLAAYQFQVGNIDETARACTSALDLRAGYPPALLLRGKILLAQNKFVEAVAALRVAEKQNPLPEYQWALADALDAAGRSPEAREVEARLRRTGASTDPRSFALFLATRGEQSALALHLAREELAARADVFTHDAIAWTELSNGNLPQAQQSMRRALAEGTQDARLFVHAAAIAARVGQTSDAEKFVQKSSALAHLLLPSERKHLHTVTAQLQQSHSVAATARGENFSAGDE